MMLYLVVTTGRKWPPFKETGNSSETMRAGQFPTNAIGEMNIEGREIQKSLVMFFKDGVPLCLWKTRRIPRYAC
ncbi:hypothetical protein [Pseudomonas sp. Q1-7]|uniref:hypothetical protein n=1 Tax=Pseudomonas sp. Q1-7 TaxID=3020843 RepID=UPI0022FFD9E0|nr:hypothetical protein [Pseudomonas sp. Q1-7]